MSNFHKLHRINTKEYQQEIENVSYQQNIPTLHKAPIEYSPDEGGIITNSLKTPNKAYFWNQIHEAQLPNGLTYKQFKRDDAFVHQLYHPNHSNPVAEVRTRAVGHPDYDRPQEHMVTWSQTDPAFKRKGLGRQAYLATVLHGKGINQLNSGHELSLKGHEAWKQLSKVPGLHTKLAPYATELDYQMDRNVWNMAGKKHHSIKISNPEELNTGAMFPQVDLGETKLVASEKLEKANVKPKPRFVGEISEDRKNIGIDHPKIGLTWDATPEVKRRGDEKTISTAREWLKTQNPEHHQLLKDFINHVMQSPNRYLRFGSDYHGGPETPKQRHIHQMVQNHPDTQLTIHSPNSLTLSVRRHGTMPKISNFHFNNEKNIVKSESLCYNGLYGHYSDLSGNGHKFYIDGSRLDSILGKNEVGNESWDGFLQFSRRPEELVVNRICDLLKSFGHGSVRGNVWGELQIHNERGNGVPQGDGALLLKSQMNPKKYTLKYHTPKGQGAYGLHTVTAHDHKGNVVGELSAEDLGDGTFQANMVEVHPEHRRKGIAGAMYDHMKLKTGLNAVPDLEAQTDDARKFWASRKPVKKSEEIFNSLQKASASKKLLGMLGLAAATTIPMSMPSDQVSTKEYVSAPVERYVSSSDQKKNIDLKAIAQVESRGGKDTKHKTITTGPHAGSSAVGSYGLMPLTIKDLVSKEPALKKYRGVLKQNDSEIHNLATKHPTFEREVASAYYDKLNNAFDGDINHIAHAWLNGKAGTNTAIKKGKKISDHWHVRKVIKERNKLLGIYTPEEKRDTKPNKQKPSRLPATNKIRLP